MARAGILQAKAAARGITVAQLIDEALACNGSAMLAASALGVHINAIYFWQRKQSKQAKQQQVSKN